jgi:hypothetical protein
MDTNIRSAAARQANVIEALEQELARWQQLPVSIVQVIDFNCGKTMYVVLRAADIRFGDRNVMDGERFMRMHTAELAAIRAQDGADRACELHDGRSSEAGPVAKDALSASARPARSLRHRRDVKGPYTRQGELKREIFGTKNFAVGSKTEEVPIDTEEDQTDTE